MNALEKLSDATRLLAEVKDAKDAKKLSDMAAVAEHYAKKAKLGEEAIDHAHAIKIEALAMLGGFLKVEVPHQGGRPSKNPSPGEGFSTLADYGLTYKESMEAQAVAEMKKESPEDFAAVKARKKSVKAARRELLRIGRFPLWLSDCEEARDATMQIRGTDMLVYGRWVIQIKCDWLAGDKKNGGSGNLFFQVAERNPLRRT